MKSISIVSFLLLLLTVANTTNATVCSAVFPEVVSSYTNIGDFRIKVFSTLYGTDGVIDIAINLDQSDTSCDSAKCISSGNTSGSLTMPTFNYTTSSQDLEGAEYGSYYIDQGSYDDVTLKDFTTTVFYNNNIETRLDNLEVGKHSTLTLAGGVYWINSLRVKEFAKIEVEAGEHAIIYVNSFSFDNDLYFNVDGDVDQLTIIGTNNMAVQERTEIRGFIYVVNTLAWNKVGTFYGAMNAKQVELNESGNFYTRVADVSNAEFNGMCDQEEILQNPIIYYSMDMCSAPTGIDAINDDIGTSDADAIGTIDIDYTGDHCQAVLLSGDQSYLDVPDPAASGLAEGSISFYFTTTDLNHSNNPSVGSMGLFSRDALGTEIGGHLTAWVTDSGAISVRQQDATSSYYITSSSNIVQENRWYHLVYTWGPSGMNLFLDGVRRGQNVSYTGGLSSNGIDMAFGANAQSFDPGSIDTRVSQLRDFFKGSIDELKIFDEQLSKSQISTLAAFAPQPCTNCTTDPVLLAHWGSDVCSIEENLISETIASLDATIHNDVSIEASSRFCQGLSFSGTQSYATIAPSSRLQVSQGAISLWFKIPDLSHSNDGYAGGNGLIAKDMVNYSNGDNYEVRVDVNGRIQVRYQSTYYTTTYGTAAIVVTEDQWHHLVLSFGPGGAKIYVDNVLQYSNDSYTVGVQHNDDVLVFGATSRLASRHATSASNFNDFLQGEMDQIKFYENQPSAADVSDWYLEAPSSCTTCNSLVAEYSFDQTNTETSFIADISGNNNTATLGSKLSTVVLSDNISCNAMLTLEDSDTAAKFYLDSGVDVNELGNQGSISFWYRANDVWNDGLIRQLFDATDSGEDFYFFLSKQTNGAIRLGLEDTLDRDLLVTTNAKTYAANTWVHISVQWNIDTSEYSIYLDGQEQTVTIASELISTSVLADMTSIVFGDNKTNYNVNGSGTNPSNGYIDDVRIYSQAISSTQITSDMLDVSACGPIDHYLIEHPTNALNCDLPEIVVKACLNPTCTSISSKPSTITLTPNKFTQANTVTFTGLTTLNINNDVGGILTLGSSSQDPAAPIVCDNNCDVFFETAGLQFFNRITGESNFNASQFIAQDDLALLGIRVVGTDSGEVCEGIVAGAKNVDVTYECINTASEAYSPTSCNVPFAGIPLTTGSSHNGIVSLHFDANGETNFSGYNYADAGILRLTATTSIDSVTTRTGTVDLRIVPANLLITDLSGAVNTAGEPISLSLTALGSSGATLPGYQSNDFQLGAQRLIPSDISAHDSEFYLDATTSVTTSLDAQFTAISTVFTSGIASTSTAYMEEVGTYKIDVQDNDYLGAVIEAESITLGRFIPAYFDVEQSHQPTLQNTCSALFTYVDEDFSFTAGLEPSVLVTAYNALGQITRNYTDTLWTLHPTLAALSAEYQLVDESTYSGALTQSSDLTSIGISGTDLYDGKATFVANGLSYNYAKVVAPTGVDASPFAGVVDYTLNQAWFTDTDSVCYQSAYPGACEAFTFNDVSGVNLRYGRVNIKNAFGPENEVLSVPIFTEYLDAGQWRVNTQDNCTALSLTQASGDIILMHDPQSSVNLASMETSLNINTAMINGIAPFNGIELGPYMVSGEAQSGSFYIELAPSSVTGHWSNYLNFDWNNDGLIDTSDKPAANINFGIYNSNERTLHWREVLN